MIFMANTSSCYTDNVGPKLLARVKALSGVNGDLSKQPEDNRMKTTLRAFLCHATEDKEIARPLAEELQRNGIDTFYDEWEIGPGDSLRRKIDKGIEYCTHFIVLLTPISIQKPWVNEEIDAGFVQNLEGKCKFIPLRCGLDDDLLPPLLKAKYFLTLNGSHDESNIKKLINSIYGISDRPPLGEPPQVIKESSGGALGLSHAAEAIAKIMIEGSENGMIHDPTLSPNQIKEATGLDDDDIIAAVGELESQGYVKALYVQGAAPFGFGYVCAENALFVAFDKAFNQGNPEDDALQIAADLVNDSGSGHVSEMAKKHNWTPRRMNPAVSYLIENGLVGTNAERGGHPWIRRRLYKTLDTDRFVRDRE